MAYELNDSAKKRFLLKNGWTVGLNEICEHNSIIGKCFSVSEAYTYSIQNNVTSSEQKPISAIAYMLRSDERTIKKRGRAIRNIDFIDAMKRYPYFKRVEATHFCNTLTEGIRYIGKAEKYVKVFREQFGIECGVGDVIGFKEVKE